MAKQTDIRWAAISSPDEADLLDNLTAAHAQLVERFGPAGGMPLVAPPASADRFATEQARLAAEIEAETDAGQRARHVLSRETARHEQLGLLATNVASYVAVYGDPDDVEPFREFGRDKLRIASEMRQAGMEPSDLLQTFVTDETRAGQSTRQAGRNHTGRDP